MPEWTQPNQREVTYRRTISDVITLTLYGDTHGEWFAALKSYNHGEYHALVDTCELTSPIFRADSPEEAQATAERFAKEAIEAMEHAATALREGLDEGNMEETNA